VLDAGNVRQFGAPLELYQHPHNKFVAGFIGSPKMNFITGAEAAKHDCKTIGIRPEHLSVSATEGPWKGRVGVSEHLGSDTFFYVHDSGLGDDMTVRVTGEVELRAGDDVYLTPDPDKIHRFDDKGLRIK
jgi:multiple sugar transport system ATP-binding protein